MRRIGAQMDAVLRGVIDTPDVNLNVSREMLQHSPVITKIRKSLVKRVLSELKKSIEKRRDDYQNFWDGFGRVIKEGIYEDADNRAKILEVSFFKSAKSSEMVTLDEYIDAFAEGQQRFTICLLRTRRLPLVVRI